MEIRRKRADSTPGPPEWFTGQVWMDEIAAPVPPSRTRVFSVHFAPGARTAWHRHPFGQVLHVTDGDGLVQSRGGAAEAIRAGDTVQAAAGEWHWHGAGPGTFMTHLAVQEADADGRTTEWGEHVTDAEYRAVLEGAGVRVGPGALGRRAGQARAHRGRIAPRGQLMAHVRREPHGGWLRRVLQLSVDVRGRGHDHHHEGDREHQQPGGSGQARRPGALPAYHGRHLSYPVSQLTPFPCTSTVGIGRQKIRRCEPPNVIGGFP